MMITLSAGYARQSATSGALLGLLLALTGCANSHAVPNRCSASAGSATDLSSEPSYTATYLHRWTLDGCAVRLDVLMTRDGACGPADLLMGTPLGASSNSGHARIYVRGDTTGVGGGATGFRKTASLPVTATDTGFRQDGKELWLVRGDDSFVFIRNPAEERVEAWPLDPRPVACM